LLGWLLEPPESRSALAVYQLKFFAGVCLSLINPLLEIFLHLFTSNDIFQSIDIINNCTSSSASSFSSSKFQRGAVRSGSPVDLQQGYLWQSAECKDQGDVSEKNLNSGAQWWEGGRPWSLVRRRAVCGRDSADWIQKNVC